MLILKILAAPFFIALATLAGRRWGPRVGGWLVALPFTSAPVMLFLAIEQGSSFAARAAHGTILGLFSLCGYSIAYAWMARFTSWPACLLGSWIVFAAVTLLLKTWSMPLLLTFILVAVALQISLRLLPRHPSEKAATRAFRGEIYFRMAAATGMVLAITALAPRLGPQLSGLITPFPVYASTLAVFTHHFHSAEGAAQVLHGLLAGLFSFALFFLVIAAGIEHWGIILSFLAAALAAITSHLGSLWLMHRKRKTT